MSGRVTACYAPQKLWWYSGWNLRPQVPSRALVLLLTAPLPPLAPSLPRTDLPSLPRMPQVALTSTEPEERGLAVPEAPCPTHCPQWASEGSQSPSQNSYPPRGHGGEQQDAKGPQHRPRGQAACPPEPGGPGRQSGCGGGRERRALAASLTHSDGVGAQDAFHAARTVLDAQGLAQVAEGGGLGRVEAVVVFWSTDQGEWASQALSEDGLMPTTLSPKKQLPALP